MISRPCYDKFHRCPGWAGGGTRYAKRQRCKGGTIGLRPFYGDPYRGRLWAWKLNRCRTCGVVVLPYMIRYVDPRYLICWELKRRLRSLRKSRAR